jgi:nucleotide-binding universal stress UspA family protein
MVDENRIVVGVDGSPGSRAALRWAVAQALLAGRSVEAVCAWSHADGRQWQARATNYGWVPVPVLPSRDEVRESTAAELARVVAAEVGDIPPAPVTLSTPEGHAATALLAAARGAGMLVLGQRGHGGFAGLRLGSVTRHCSEHAPCPVVIIPAGDESVRGES